MTSARTHAVRSSIAVVAALALAGCASTADAPQADRVTSRTTGSRPAGPGPVSPAPVTSAPGDPLAPAPAPAPAAVWSGLPASPTAGSSVAPAPPSAQPTPAPTPSSTRPQLPGGGTTLFPRYRLVGFSGGPGSAAFGRLGIGDLDARVREIEHLDRSYATDGRRPLPVLELITVVVQAHPGSDGKYHTQIDDAQIARYLAAARRHKALLLLNIQPGRADFLAEVKGLRHWLAQPDVGIALDPEWAIGSHQIPGRVFGHTTARQLNVVTAWLSAFTRARGLPEKALVVHQLAPQIISNVPGLKRYPGVEVVLSVDGIGSRAAKVSTWRKLVKPLPAGIHPGFKLFYQEDRRHGKLMTPAQVLALTPTPDYVLYE